VLVGTAEVDHRSIWLIEALLVGGPGTYCPRGPPPYSGSPWTYTASQNLTAGTYTWGVVCGYGGNITVTQSIEILFNGQD